MDDDTVRCSLDVMYYEIVVFFIDKIFKQILNGESIRHKFCRPQHKAKRYDNV